MNLFQLRYITFNKDVNLPHQLFVDASEYETAFNKNRVAQVPNYFTDALEGTGAMLEAVEDAERYFRGLVIFHAKHQGYRIGRYLIEGTVPELTYDWPTLFTMTYLSQPLESGRPVTRYAPDLQVPLGSLTTYK